MRQTGLSTISTKWLLIIGVFQAFWESCGRRHSGHVLRVRAFCRAAPAYGKLGTIGAAPIRGSPLAL
jgi:hypothetical protein